MGTNIPTSERIATGIVGAAAILLGVRRRTIGGVLIAGAGAIAVARAVAGRCPLYRARAIRRGISVRRAVTIGAKPSQIYAMYRDLENLPRFMSHVKSVSVESPTISRWVVEVGGRELAWRAEIVEDTPNRRLRWKSLDGDIQHEGEVEFREEAGDRGTVVEVKLRYLPPGGLLVASTLYGFLRKLALIDLGTELVRLRQLLETGELATGARRLDELGARDKAASAPQIAQLRSSSPVATAQTSAHDVQSRSGGSPLGGPR